MPERGLIDLHHHVFPPALLAELEQREPQLSSAVQAMAGPGPVPTWDPSTIVDYMDSNQVAAAIATTAFGVHFGDDDAAVDLARRCNDYVAELARTRPDRFGGFGALPLPDVDTALAELDRIYDELHLDGVMLSTNYGGTYLGDPAFDAVFEALERRESVVFVHPAESPDEAARALQLPNFLVNYPADTTRAIAKLHYSNTFARTPSVKYVFSHAGGTVPFLLKRFDLLDTLPMIPGFEERGPAREQIKKLWFDTAIAFDEPVLRFLKDTVGTDRLVFGSDRPFAADFPETGAAAVAEGSSVLTAEEHEDVAWSTATALLPRWAQG